MIHYNITMHHIPLRWSGRGVLKLFYKHIAPLERKTHCRPLHLKIPIALYATTSPRFTYRSAGAEEELLHLSINIPLRWSGRHVGDSTI